MPQVSGFFRCGGPPHTRTVGCVEKESQPEDSMYAATQDAVTAQIAYRQHRLADEFRRGVRTNTRRWNRSGH